MDKGRKILFKTFWNSNGYWYTEPTQEEFALAVAEGYMFEETKQMSHEETLLSLQETVQKVSPQDVANAFLYSLSTRELAYRSPMGTYWYAKAVPFHEPENDMCCGYCGWQKGYRDLTSPGKRIRIVTYDKHTLENSCNFDRHKFGGRSHSKTQYALFDLNQFLQMPKVTPTETDRTMLREILHSITELEPRKKAGAYRDLLVKKKIIPANKLEIDSLIDILGLCGILSTSEHPCPDVEFRGYAGIDPPEIRSNIAYPANWWRAENGVNQERFLKVFGFDYSDL